MQEQCDILIYGCTGYTGRLVAERAAAGGLRPLLAGRNEEKVRAVGEALGLPWKCVNLDNDQALRELLQPVKVVVHCAGPFARTAQPMIAACLFTRTHYTDITGEMEVFEYARRLGEKAREVGIMLLPGTGFDVVPTDCLAAYLKGKLPAAEALDLALLTRGGKMSHGTMTTVVENLPHGGAVRRNGKIVQVPHAWRTREFDFGFGRYRGVTIPWGDVSTAYTSTAIPNIRVYNCVPPKTLRGMQLMRWFTPLLGMRPVQAYLKKRVDRAAAGPDAQQRERAKSYVWGEVRSGAGPAARSMRAMVECPDGYSLTADASLRIARMIAGGEYTPGYQTPSTAFGPDLVLTMDGVSRRDLP